jgi:hypothetical protein
VRPTHHFDAAVTNLDLGRFTDFEQLRALKFAGTASLHNVLEWPSGRFSEHRGGGRLVVTPPPGVVPMTSTLSSPLDRGAAARSCAARESKGVRSRRRRCPSICRLRRAHLHLRPDEVVDRGRRFVTEKTHVAFAGRPRTANARACRFTSSSGDWQESDQVLVGIITDFGADRRSVEFGGRGEFDGVMTGAFRSPASRARSPATICARSTRCGVAARRASSSRTAT